MAIDYAVKLQIVLEPVGTPWLSIEAGNQRIQQQLFCQTQFEFDFVASSQTHIKVTHFNKPSNDPSTAVIIKSIAFFGISDPRFVWSGEYTPEYPEPWYSQQSPPPPTTLINANHLGWNGTWTLKFDVPVFSWIHRVQNLGWIYS